MVDTCAFLNYRSDAGELLGESENSEPDQSIKQPVTRRHLLWWLPKRSRVLIKMSVFRLWKFFGVCAVTGKCLDPERRWGWNFGNL
jgi:hypothetical protein